MRLGALLLLAACTVDKPAAEVGAELFADPQGLSRSQFNPFSCATCHQTEEASDPGRLDAGYSLWGAARRATFWGGNETRLLDAVDVCLVYFMRGDPLDPESPEGRALYAFLTSIAPAGAEPLPFSVVEQIQPIPQGDEGRGAELYDRACHRCHGAPHTGDGQILEERFILPEDTAQYDELFPGVPHGLVVIEKIRHGRFFNVGGTMPLFSREAISDEQIGDLLAFLGLPSS